MQTGRVLHRRESLSGLVLCGEEEGEGEEETGMGNDSKMDTGTG